MRNCEKQAPSRQNGELQPGVEEGGGGGGARGPVQPRPRDDHHLCILVPFRDRWEELLEFAPHMKQFLADQAISHEIWILNQADELRYWYPLSPFHMKIILTFLDLSADHSPA